MKLRVETNDLELGMFVEDLDRPWHESPFLVQGFLIEDETELAQLRQACVWVVIETDRSRQDIDFAALAGGDDDGEIEDFRELARRSAETARRTHQLVVGSLEEVRLGHTINPHAAQLVVDELVDEVSDNTNAALWLTGLKKRNSRVATHCLNVCVLAVSFARHLGYAKDELSTIGLGALLHDIGLGTLPSVVLDKPAPLDSAERAGIVLHPQEGVRIMRATKLVPKRVLDIIQHHHERVDGTGYPDGLGGDGVDRAVRIVAICDTYDAMTTDQPWRKAMLPQVALTTMMRECHGSLGKLLVEEFIRFVGIYPIGSLVRLNTGALAVVLASTPESRLKPIVMMLREPDGRPSPPSTIVNLQAIAKARRYDPITIRELVDPRVEGVDVEDRMTREIG